MRQSLVARRGRGVRAIGQNMFSGGAGARNSLPEIILTMQLNFKILRRAVAAVLFFRPSHDAV
ncbi:hypothetical protein [Paraburkholderia sp. DGU8]|jgi:hypothetical protein|uniref:hypothetical protein n=1 Tax=Paraburkholderia sp. DGU8 TaxID=3161997 RepID=UPI0034677404